MGALLLGLTIKTVLFLSSSAAAIRVRTILVGLTAVCFGLGLIGSIHRTAETYLAEKGVVYESVLIQRKVGNYSVARTLDYSGTFLGGLFLFLAWKRNEISFKEQ